MSNDRQYTHFVEIGGFIGHLAVNKRPGEGPAVTVFIGLDDEVQLRAVLKLLNAQEGEP